MAISETGRGAATAPFCLPTHCHTEILMTEPQQPPEASEPTAGDSTETEPKSAAKKKRSPSGKLRALERQAGRRHEQRSRKASAKQGRRFSSASRYRG